MRTTLLATTLLVSLTAAPAFAQTTNSPSTQPSIQPQPRQGVQAQTPQVSAQTQQFMRQAAIGNMYEITSSELAVSKSDTDAIERFANDMIQDHRTVGRQMQQLSQQVNVQPPQQLDQRHQQMIEQLQQLSGARFDQMYVQQQVMAHQEAVQLYRQYAQSGDNPTVQEFARTTLPTLEEHLADAQTLAQSAPGGAAGSTGAQPPRTGTTGGGSTPQTVR